MCGVGCPVDVTPRMRMVLKEGTHSWSRKVCHFDADVCAGNPWQHKSYSSHNFIHLDIVWKALESVNYF